MDDDVMSREGAREIANEAVDDFAELYPKLALPLDVWATLKEMIEREVLRNDGVISDEAGGLGSHPLYIKRAIANGLRDPDRSIREAALEEAAQACVGSGAIVAEARLCASAIRALKGQAR